MPARACDLGWKMSEPIETDGGALSNPARIEISPEMTALIGAAPAGEPSGPANPVALSFKVGDPATLSVDVLSTPESRTFSADDAQQLTLLITRAALVRLGGAGLLETQRSSFYLPSELLVIIIALREMSRPCESLVTYRGAKSIELLCETIRLFRQGELHPMVGDTTLTSRDTRKVFAARRLIDERWNEKLTLEGVSRACGINRAKLTRGFRMVFDCTIAEAIAERRFVQASRLLLTTDLPVYRVGYESGYQNNASFARAFGRHFGVSPTDYRSIGIAA